MAYEIKKYMHFCFSRWKNGFGLIFPQNFARNNVLKTSILGLEMSWYI